MEAGVFGSSLVLVGVCCQPTVGAASKHAWCQRNRESTRVVALPADGISVAC